ncbi:MAG: hypothetical protein ABF449_06875, partial [Ethanoligenens sp.]
MHTTNFGKRKLPDGQGGAAFLSNGELSGYGTPTYAFECAVFLSPVFNGSQKNHNSVPNGQKNEKYGWMHAIVPNLIANEKQQ